ncbi:MAG: acetamidase/formamidase family protein [Defluviitaleaceae bacterium]|nr:acetamidase/formamidase family protein [Defluviitaleaceae bacterium]
MTPVRVDTLNYEFNKATAPAVTVKSGTFLTFVTSDCFSGQVTRENYKTVFGGAGFDWDNMNPTAGPVAVEGAKPGDVLRVEILDITLTRDFGAMSSGKGIGANKEFFDELIARTVDFKNNMAVFSPDIKVPLNPMIGVIGTAPAGEPKKNGWPGEHGGNMDCKMIKEGAIVYLPVQVEGGLLSMGDVHAVQGDGEVGGSGAECPAEILVKVELLKDCKWPTPFVENDTHFMPIASRDDLDEAVDVACKNAVDFLMGEYGMDRYDAITLLSLAADARICQIVDPLMTARVDIPKKLVRFLKK